MNSQNIADFITMAERLECEYRLTRMSDGMPQSVASHSWNMAMMALVLRPYLQKQFNMRRVLELCLVHDLPEAIAHDVPFHAQTDEVRAEKQRNETAAIKLLTGKLDDDYMRDLFAEYENRQSIESKLVKALDRLDTVVQHVCARNLSYIFECYDGFYLKLVFSKKFASYFDFEPALRMVFDELCRRVAMRVRTELNINPDIYKE